MKESETKRIDFKLFSLGLTSCAVSRAMGIMGLGFKQRREFLLSGGKFPRKDWNELTVGKKEEIAFANVLGEYADICRQEETPEIKKYKKILEKYLKIDQINKHFILALRVQGISPVGKKVIDMTIIEFFDHFDDNLSVKTKILFQGLFLQDVREMLAMRESSIFGIPGFESEAIREMKALIEPLGLTFGMKFSSQK